MEKKLNKTPFGSKKFIAAMSWNLLWLILIGYGIHTGQDKDFLIAMVYTSGLVQSLYLGGQSAVDAFVRTALAKINDKAKDVVESQSDN